MKILMIIVTLMCVITMPIQAATPTKDDRLVAAEEFKLGRAQEKLQGWSAAISHYKNSLMLVPGYFWAHKQIGFCHYKSGNYDSAFESYRNYLKANPKDKQTARFVANLMKQLKSGELNKRLAPRKTGREQRSTPYIGVGGGALIVGPDDVKKAFPDHKTTASGSIPFFTIEGGYLFSSGIYMQVTSMRGMKRNVSAVKSTKPGVADITFDISQSALLGILGWGFRVGKNGLLGFQGGGGSTSISGDGGTSESSVAWIAQLRADWLLGTQFSLGLKAGYFGSQFNDFQLNHTGYGIQGGLQWYLFPMRDRP